MVRLGSKFTLIYMELTTDRAVKAHRDRERRSPHFWYRHTSIDA